MTATNRVLVFADKKTRALTNVSALGEGTGKDSKPVRPQALLSNLQLALTEDFDTDAHVVSYHLTEPDGALHFHRLAKNALPQIRALGGQVLCSTVFLDVDLNAVLGAKGKVAWDSLDADASQALWAKLCAPVPGLPAPAYVYRTKHGARLVLPLAFDVPAGAVFEAVLRRVHDAYLAAGILIDQSCKDWTRLYRLPRVLRDGVPTYEQPWFRVHAAEEGADIYLTPEDEDLNAKDDSTVVHYSAADAADCPTDEECHGLLYDDHGKPHEATKAIRQRYRTHPLGIYLTGQQAVIPDGKRNDTIVKMAGLLARSEVDIRVCYAVIVESIKLLNDDEPWRDLAWQRLNEFRAQDDAQHRAEQRILPDRLKKRPPAQDNASAPEHQQPAQAAPEIDEETGLRVIPPWRTTKPWLQEAIEADELVLNEKGTQAIVTPQNVAVMLNRHGYALHRDMFAESIRIDGDEGLGRTLSDWHILDLVRILGETGLKISKDQLYDQLKIVATADCRHPVRAYLSDVYTKWDKQKRVERWLSTYFGAEDNEYTRCAGTVTLVGCVRRVFEPGCKHDTMLILEGGQGGFKSSALRILAVHDQWFTDNMRVDADSRQIIEAVAGHWIVEAAEVIGMRKGDTDKLKAAISRTKERARMAYGQTVNEYQRQFVIFGTTNHEHYLNDDTGNRRFWPVKVGEVDIDALARDRDQLWAEAVTLWMTGEYDVMPPHLYAAATAEQEKRRALFVNPDHEALSGALDGIEAGVFDLALLWKALGMNNAGRRCAAIRETLRTLGWRKVRSSRSLYAIGEGEVPVYDVTPLGEGSYKFRKTNETKAVT